MISRHQRCLLLALWLMMPVADPAVGVAGSHDHSIPPNFPRSLEQDLRKAQEAAESPGATIGDLVRLATVYLDIGDDLYTDPMQRRQAYEEGAEAAGRALALNEEDAETHFLYAANLGNAVQLGNRAQAVLSLSTIKNHVERALELNPRHARALQFMGGLLAELPWVLGGSVKKAEHYLKRAIEADFRYTKARLLLAKVYLKENRVQEAREQLDALVNTTDPHFPYHWLHTFRPEAQRLLQSLE